MKESSLKKAIQILEQKRPVNGVGSVTLTLKEYRALLELLKAEESDSFSEALLALRKSFKKLGLSRVSSCMEEAGYSALGTLAQIPDVLGHAQAEKEEG